MGEPGQIIELAPKSESSFTQILQAVVETSEVPNLVNPDDTIAGFSVSQIRGAAKNVAKEIFSRHKTTLWRPKEYHDGVLREVPGKKEKTGFTNTTEKSSSLGVAQLEYKVFGRPSGTIAPNFEVIRLALYDHGDIHRHTPIMQMIYPLTDVGDDTDARYVAWDDHREYEHISDKHLSGLYRRKGSHVALLDNKPFSEEDMKFLFRGTRWLFANILKWDSAGVIFPEQLDEPTRPLRSMFQS